MYKILYDFTCYYRSFGGDVATSFQKNFKKKKKKKKTDMETICLLPQDLMHATEFRPLFL